MQNKKQEQLLKLTEAQLHQIIRESVDDVLMKEGVFDRIYGGIKGGAQAGKAMWNLRKMNKAAQKNGETPIQPANNRKSNWSKFKTSVMNQAADSDRDAEISKLMDQIKMLQLNNYFDFGNTRYYWNKAEEFLQVLQTMLDVNNQQTQAQYKRNFAQDHPDKIANQQAKKYGDISSRGGGSPRKPEYVGDLSKVY